MPRRSVPAHPEYFKLIFDRIDMGCFVFACGCGVWYLLTKVGAACEGLLALAVALAAATHTHTHTSTHI